jgi:signal transduction histidine kinase
MRTRLFTLADRFGFGSPPGAVYDASQRSGPRRLAASGVLGLTGVALLVPNLVPILEGAGPVAVALSAFGSVVSVGLAVAGAFLYRSRFSDRNAVRIAVWNVLGVVVLGTVMVAQAAARGSLPDTASPSAFAVANLLAIGAAAHVVIGVYDARRVRAEQLARERRRTAVLNRVLRHNLRNEAQVLGGHADIVADGAEGDLARSAEAIGRTAETIAGLAEGAKAIARTRDRTAEDYARTDAATVLDEAAAHARDRFPDVSVTVERDVGAGGTADGAPVRASAGLRTALDELFENAAEHGGSHVEASLRLTDDDVAFLVADDGPGIPDHERRVVEGDAEITQLTHGSGLGLWVVEAVADAHGGEVRFEDRPDGGSAVRLTLPSA